MKKCLLLILLLAACAHAPAQTPDCASLTREALDLSGFNQSIDRTAAIFASSEFMQQFRGRQSAEEFISVFRPILLKEFNPALLRREMHERVAARCDAEQMARTVEQLQTPFQARMLALEAATNTPEGQQQLQKYIDIAKTAPPTDERLEAIDAIDNSLGASDFITDMVMATTRGMMTGLGAPPELIAQFEARRRDVKAQMQNNIELTMSVTYHGVTRPELLQYAREVGAQPLKGFYSLVNKTFAEIVEERARAMGQDLKKTLPPHQN
jgi:hypothetical protein